MISVIVPAYNEEAGIRLLYDRVTAAASAWQEAFELIVVDDGSRDTTLAILKSIAASDNRLKVLSFTRNFGHQASVTAGLAYAAGDYIAIIDADLQDPPEILGGFLEKCRAGFDVVYAIRMDRKEAFLKRAAYHLYYRLLAALASVDIPMDSGDCCVMSRRALDTLNALPERNRFVRGLRTWIGYRQVGVAYERQARASGSPKYTLRKLINLALDGVINFSFKPLRILGLAGMMIGGLAFLAGLIVVYQYFTNTTILGYNPHQARGWTSLILSILFLSGFQLFGLGILGEYIGRLFEETKRRPPYLIDTMINFPHQERGLYPGRRRADVNAAGERIAHIPGTPPPNR